MADKETKDAVDYRRAVPGSMERCQNCTMYRPNANIPKIGTCTAVAGPIRGWMVCNLFKMLKRLVSQ